MPDSHLLLRKLIVLILALAIVVVINMVALAYIIRADVHIETTLHNQFMEQKRQERVIDQQNTALNNQVVGRHIQMLILDQLRDMNATLANITTATNHAN
jgi:hypothetical protein